MKYIVGTALRRCCSRSEALLPSAFACSNSCCATARFFVFALTTLSPMRMVMPWTAARVEAGKTSDHLTSAEIDNCNISHNSLFYR